MVVFDKANHRYYESSNGKEVTYISVTTLLGTFCKPFDTQVAAQYAHKRGLNPHDVRAEWKRISRESLLFGNKVHSHLEDYFKGNSVSQLGEQVRDSILEHIEHPFCKYESEKMIYNKDLRVAGTVDLLVNHEGGTSIVDFKTIKDMQSLSKSYNSMLHFKIPDSKENKYWIQIAMYSHILNLLGYRIENRHIVLVNKDLNIETLTLTKDESRFYDEIATEIFGMWTDFARYMPS